ncbi:Rubredoxin [Chitinophaga sp. YR573]|uniref:rubredoxin n=1 Tax=Chitinophaga sp. YR573 TaxID=1881040 RepID=UPI0008D8AEAD|nr:rubredoxin [Chitinophaga sp. YR573]SEW27636.1 Rubredoxin [Chitinophaga sp. YR573]
MLKQTHTISINFTGGIISPGNLHTILEIATDARVKQVRFGLRQQLLIEVPVKQIKQFENACKEKDISCASTPNISSSYLTSGIFVTDTWLTEGIYKDVFEMFSYTPSLKINICDSKQTFMPFFTGHLNWISAKQQHYWHLYIRYPKTGELFSWPELIYTNNIGEVSNCIESFLSGNETTIQIDHLFTQVKEKLEYLCRPIEQELEYPHFHLPYYEGFNKHDDSYWLGIYRRDEEFSVDFLKDLCNICLETKTGQLYATSWKSLIIKNIKHEHRRLWDYILGKHNINVRHAANELNWQVEDNSEDGLVLKRHIIRYFDSADVRTYGLCFGIRLKPGNSCFGSIILNKQENRQKSRLKGLQRYDILYTPDFSPNSGNLIPYRTDVAKEYLGPYISALCKLFYESSHDPLQKTIQPLVVAIPEKPVHQCPHCFTVYDEITGDPAQQIPAGTLFSDLPPYYCCSVCEAPLQDFNITMVEHNFNIPS